MKISVLLADDNKLFRELLAHRFSETDEIVAIGEAEDHMDIMNQVKENQPDILLMDINLPRMKGIETTRQLLNDHPNCKVVALTSHAEKIHIKGALNAGVCGYYLKNCSFDLLENGIKQIHGGKKTLSMDVENLILEDFLGRKSNPIETLSLRESQILKLLAEGKSVKEISEDIFISIKTVGTHKQNIYDKMGFENLAQLVKYAINQGIVY